MYEIKVLLAGDPQQMLDLVGGPIQSQKDIKLVGEVIDSFDLLLTVKITEADVVIISLRNADDDDPGIISHLLAEYPDLLIIAISRISNLAHIYRQTISKEKLFSISSEEILKVIRTVKEG